MSADSTLTAIRAWERALCRRYPGVAVTIEHVEGAPALEGYTGWLVDFVAAEELLIRHGLVTLEELSKEDLPSDSFGHTRHIYPENGDRLRYSTHVPDCMPEGNWRERRVHTKKMQQQVTRLLKKAFSLPSSEPQP